MQKIDESWGVGDCYISCSFSSMKKIFLLLFLTWLCQHLQARQQKDSLFLVQLNQQIDEEVVEKNMTSLRNRYTSDFIFSHGTGKVEGKESWLQAVSRGNFISRTHDSVKAEMHGNIGIIRGKLTVVRGGEAAQQRYFIRYVRVYMRKQRSWQMISHYTFFEYHYP